MDQQPSTTDNKQKDYIRLKERYSEKNFLYNLDNTEIIDKNILKCPYKYNDKFRRAIHDQNKKYEELYELTIKKIEIDYIINKFSNDLEEYKKNKNNLTKDKEYLELYALTLLNIPKKYLTNIKFEDKKQSDLIKEYIFLYRTFIGWTQLLKEHYLFNIYKYAYIIIFDRYFYYIKKNDERFKLFDSISFKNEKNIKYDFYNDINKLNICNENIISDIKLIENKIYDNILWYNTENELKNLFKKITTFLKKERINMSKYSIRQSIISFIETKKEKDKKIEKKDFEKIKLININDEFNYEFELIIPDINEIDYAIDKKDDGFYKTLRGVKLYYNVIAIYLQATYICKLNSCDIGENSFIFPFKSLNIKYISTDKNNYYNYESIVQTEPQESISSKKKSTKPSKPTKPVETKLEVINIDKQKLEKFVTEIEITRPENMEDDKFENYKSNKKKLYTDIITDIPYLYTLIDTKPNFVVYVLNNLKTNFGDKYKNFLKTAEGKIFKAQLKVEKKQLKEKKEKDLNKDIIKRYIDYDYEFIKSDTESKQKNKVKYEEYRKSLFMNWIKKQEEITDITIIYDKASDDIKSRYHNYIIELYKDWKKIQKSEDLLNLPKHIQLERTSPRKWVEQQFFDWLILNIFYDVENLPFSFQSNYSEYLKNIKKDDGSDLTPEYIKSQYDKYIADLDVINKNIDDLPEIIDKNTGERKKKKYEKNNKN